MPLHIPLSSIIIIIIIIITALSEVTEADRAVKMWNGAEGLLVMCTSSLIKETQYNYS